MRIYPICIVPFPLNPFFSMVLVRLYGNSWKWQLLRGCFAEWIIRMDQFGEMSKTKQVVNAETSRSGASGKRTLKGQLSNELLGRVALLHRFQEGGITLLDALCGWML